MIDNLPDDLALRIFSHLPAKTLASGPGRVNRRLRYLSNDHKLWSDHLQAGRQRGWFTIPSPVLSSKIPKLLSIPAVPEWHALRRTDHCRQGFCGCQKAEKCSSKIEPIEEYGIAYSRELAWKYGPNLRRVVLTNWAVASCHAQGGLSALAGQSIAVFKNSRLGCLAGRQAQEVANNPRPIALRHCGARAVRMCPEGRVVAAATTSPTALQGLNFFDLEKSLALVSIAPNPAGENPFAIRWLSENVVATTSHCWLSIHDYRSRETRFRVQVSSMPVHGLCVDEISQGARACMIGTGADDGRVQIWDSRRMAPREPLYSMHRKRPVRTMTFAEMPQGQHALDKLLVYACYDGTIWVHSANQEASSDGHEVAPNTAELVRILRVPGRAPVEALASSGGTIVCGGSWNSTLYASDGNTQSWRWAANDLGPIRDASIGQADEGVLVALGFEGSCLVVGRSDLESCHSCM